MDSENLVLSFRELEPFTCALLTVFLALLDAGIAGHEPGLFERGSQVSVKFQQSPGNTVTNGASLAGGPTSVNVNDDIELRRCIGQL